MHGIYQIGTKITPTTLLGGIPTPLKNMSSSVGMMTFPIYGNIKFMFQTTNQNRMSISPFKKKTLVVNKSLINNHAIGRWPLGYEWWNPHQGGPHPRK